MPTPSAVLGSSLVTLERAGDRARIPIPSNPLPFPDTADVGAAADPTWRSWNVWWYWASRGLTVLPDGSKVGVDVGIVLDTYLEPAVVATDPEGVVELFRRGPWTFYAANDACDPTKPLEPDLTEGWVARTGVSIVENGFLVASITVWDSVIPCPIPGRTITPAELVDVLAGLIDCDIGGDEATVCRDLPPITDDDRSRAIDLLSQWDLGRPDG